MPGRSWLGSWCRIGISVWLTDGSTVGARKPQHRHHEVTARPLPWMMDTAPPTTPVASLFLLLAPSTLAPSDWCELLAGRSVDATAVGHSPPWQPTLICAGAELGPRPKLSLLTGNKQSSGIVCVIQVLLEAGITGEWTLLLSLSCPSLHAVLPASVRNRIWWHKKRGLRFKFYIPQTLTESKGCARCWLPVALPWVACNGAGGAINVVSTGGGGCVPQAGDVSYSPQGSALAIALMGFEGLHGNIAGKNRECTQTSCFPPRKHT